MLGGRAAPRWRWGSSSCNVVSRLLRITCTGTVFFSQLSRRRRLTSRAAFIASPPDQVMMVAAHKDDLHAAKGVGLKTAFVPRPLEHGPKGKVDVTHEPAFDLNVGDFNELAGKLGA
jgi:hypothetical protein